MKTNAARLLDSLALPYEVDPEDLTAGTVARKIGLPLEQVWKTLVARGGRSGQRGLQILLAPDSYLQAVRAVGIGPITKPKE